MPVVSFICATVMMACHCLCEIRCCNGAVSLVDGLCVFVYVCKCASVQVCVHPVHGTGMCEHLQRPVHHSILLATAHHQCNSDRQLLQVLGQKQQGAGLGTANHCSATSSHQHLQTPQQSRAKPPPLALHTSPNLKMHCPGRTSVRPQCQ